MMLLFATAVFSCSLPQATERFPAIPDQDARHYELALHVDMGRRHLSGTVDYTFTALEELSTIRLDARRSADYQVDFVDEAGRELAAEWHDDYVVLTLPEPVAKGADLRFRAQLAGMPVDGFYFRENRYGDLMAFTDHYSIRARGWLPCEDHPGDRARFSAQIVYPEGMEIVGFGMPDALASSEVEVPDGYQAVAWTGQSEIPPYMFALVIGPLVRVAEAGDARIADHLVYRQDRDKAASALVNHAAWMGAMEQAFGDYPYGKYTTVQCPTRWGGFEAPGNVQLAESLFDREERGQGVLAHELVHMWFGDAVGYAQWREVWLSEGFASYFGPWLHAQTGGPQLRDSMVSMRDRWARSFEGRTKTIRDDGFPHPDQALNSNTYPKGAWVLHMLRAELGDELFFQALRSYFERFRGQSVTTDQFVRCLEESTGRELRSFFSQWLDRVGCPELRVQPEDGAIVIEQVQKGEPYRCWLRLRWRDASGELVERRVRLEQRRARIEVEGEVRDLQVDPDVELLFRRAG